MGRISELIVKIGADSSEFERKIAAVQRSALQTAEKLSSAGSILTQALALPLGAFGGLALKTAADLDGLRRGLTAVSGSAAAAEAQFKSLQKVAELPGLGLQEAVRGSINLQAAGLSANTAERALRAFGNALATVGKGRADLDGVILALSQIQSKGKVAAQEINQLAERLPQIRVALKDAFGTADTEAIQKLGLSTDEFITRVITQFEKLPAVTGGLGNAFENLKDTATQALARVGDAIAPFAIKAIEALTPLIIKVGELGKAFGDLPTAIQTGIISLGAIAIASGPIATVIAKFKELEVLIVRLAVAIKNLPIAFGPLAAAGGVFTVVFLAMKKLTDEGEKNLPKVNESLKQLNDRLNEISKFAAGGGPLSKVDFLTDAVFAINKTKTATLDLAGAFSRLGVTSTSDLSKALTQAQQDLAIIRTGLQQGSASALDLARAEAKVLEIEKQLSFERAKTKPPQFFDPILFKQVELQVADVKKLIEDIVVQGRSLTDLQAVAAFSIGIPVELNQRQKDLAANIDLTDIAFRQFDEELKTTSALTDPLAHNLSLSEIAATGLRHAIEEANDPTKRFNEALAVLGVSDVADSLNKAEEAFKKVFEATKGGTENVRTFQLSYIALVEAMDRAGVKISAEQIRTFEGFKRAIQSQIRETETNIKKFAREASNIIHSIGDGFVDVLAGVRTFGDIFESVLIKITKDILNVLITQGLKVLAAELAKSTGLVGKLARAFGDLLGGLGSGGGSPGSSPAKLPSGGGDAASALAGVNPAIGLAQLGVSIFSGIVSGIQQAHANNLLDNIEKNTRAAFNVILDMFKLHQELLPRLGEIHTYLFQHQGIVLDQILQVLQTGGIGGIAGGGNTINITITSAASIADPRQMAQAIIRELRLLSPSFA